MKVGDKHAYLEVLEVFENYQGQKARCICHKCGQELWLTRSKFKEQTMCYSCRCKKFGGEKAYEERLQAQRESRHKCWTCIHATNKYNKCQWSAWLIPRDDWQTKVRTGGKFYIAECGGYINDKYKEQYEKERTK